MADTKASLTLATHTTPPSTSQASKHPFTWQSLKILFHLAGIKASLPHGRHQSCHSLSRHQSFLSLYRHQSFLSLGMHQRFNSLGRHQSFHSLGRYQSFLSLDRHQSFLSLDRHQSLPSSWQASKLPFTWKTSKLPFTWQVSKLPSHLTGIKLPITRLTWGVQWLSGRVLDSRPRGCGFESHQSHINPSLVLVQPRKTCPFITERLLLGRKESKQSKVPFHLAVIKATFSLYSHQSIPFTW